MRTPAIRISFWETTGVLMSPLTPAAPSGVSQGVLFLHGGGRVANDAIVCSSNA
jgi:hypothetical protein